jgi:hypothetical protein
MSESNKRMMSHQKMQKVKKSNKAEQLTPGIYDCRGILLVAVLGKQPIKATLFGHECTLQLQADNKTLMITRWVPSEGHCRAFVEDRNNEIERLKLGMKALQVNVSAKMAEFENEYEYLDIDPGTIAKALVDLIGLRGKYRAVLTFLESYADGNVEAAQSSTGQSVVVHMNQFVQVGFFEEPIVYQQGY